MADKKMPPQKHPAVDESDFVKVYLSIVAIAGVVAAVNSFFFTPEVGETAAAAESVTPLSAVAGILAIIAWVMSIVAWVKSVKAKYPKTLTWLAAVRSLGFFIVNLGLSAYAAIVTFRLYSDLSPEEVENLTPSDVVLPDAVTYLEYASGALHLLAAVAAGYIAWNIFMKNDEKVAK